MLGSVGVFDDTPPRVLDLFAGSGALGLEALSRGGSEATLVESARPALTAIRENVRALAVDAQVTVLAMRAEQAVTKLSPESFDLVLIDPPYAFVRERAFAEFFTNTARLLAASGILVLEHAASDQPEAPAGSRLVVDRRRRHGDTVLSLFQVRV